MDERIGRKCRGGAVPVTLVPSRAVSSSRPVHFCVILTSPQPRLKAPFSAFNRPTVIVFTSNSIYILLLISQVLHHPLFTVTHVSCVVSIYSCTLPLFRPSVLFLPKFLLTSHFLFWGHFLSFWSTSFRRIFFCWGSVDVFLLRIFLPPLVFTGCRLRQ